MRVLPVRLQDYEAVQQRPEPPGSGTTIPRQLTGVAQQREDDMSKCDYCRKAKCDCLKRAWDRLKYGKDGDLIVRTSNRTPEPRPGRVWERKAKLRHGGDEMIGMAGDMGLIDSDLADVEQVASLLMVEQFSSRHLDVCRLCGMVLGGNQIDYCGSRCRQIVDNARKRAERSAPWNTEPPAFSLDSITISGVGVLNMAPEQWNAIDKTDPKHVPGPKRPWLVRRSAKRTPEENLAVNREVAEVLSDQMVRLGSSTHSLLADLNRDRVTGKPPRLDERTLDERADRLVRRYGTGGSTVRCGREGCCQAVGKRGKGWERFCSPKCREDAEKVTVSRLVWLNQIQPGGGVKLVPVRVAA